MRMLLSGKVCLVTGATRGIGKGVAAMLLKAGATVYVTGRSVNPELQIELSLNGGNCVLVKCDHGDDEQVKSVFEKIKTEQNGKLDILVNNAYAGVAIITDNIKTKFYEQPISHWDIINNVGLRSSYVAAHHAANMMIPNKQGLIINISSPGGLKYLFNVPYGVGKAATDRMMADMAVELRKHNIAAVSLWPGPALTENTNDLLSGKKGEDAARGAAKLFDEQSEDPTYTGKAIAALGCDQNIMKKSGCILVVAELAREYGFTDVGGKQPMSFRQVKCLVARSNYPGLKWLIPEFLYVPWWIIVSSQHKFW